MARNLLIAQTAIPANTIGSWNIMLTNLVKHNPDIFDCIITPKPYADAPGVTHFYAKDPTFFTRLLGKVLKFQRFKSYYSPLKKLLAEEGNWVVNIIDSTGLLSAVDYFLKRDGLRNKVRIVFHFHGFCLNSYTDGFFNMIDTNILLTKSAYKWQINRAVSMPCKVRQVYNGIDATKFHSVSENKRNELREKLALSNDKIYFLWLSQDRPKKGLHVVLRAWQKIIGQHSNVELLVVGIPKRENAKQITYLGRFPNDQLPAYYQVSDFYLFPTLWHEGHPLSLTEAMKSGAVCIASDIDPVSEVMNDGKYGRLVDFPNNPDSWVLAINEELEKYKEAGNVNLYSKNMPEDLYDMKVWMNEIGAVMKEEQLDF